MGVTFKITVTILVAVRGVAPHVLINTDDAHSLETIRIIDEYALAFT